jgi:hypothetical protein
MGSSTSTVIERPPCGSERLAGATPASRRSPGGRHLAVELAGVPFELGLLAKSSPNSEGLAACGRRARGCASRRSSWEALFAVSDSGRDFAKEDSKRMGEVSRMPGIGLAGMRESVVDRWRFCDSFRSPRYYHPRRFSRIGCWFGTWRSATSGTGSRNPAPVRCAPAAPLLISSKDCGVGLARGHADLDELRR